MQFFAPEYFFFFWFIPAIAGLTWLADRARRKNLERFGLLSTIRNKLMPDHRPGEHRIRAAYLILAVLFATLALTRPQWGEEKRKVQRKGVDLIFLLDTSLSMMAEDIKPNRLEKSKLEIKNMVRRLKGDRIGMVAFAGTGFLQSPLTLDYSAFFLFLEAVKTGYIPDPGTSLERAIRIAARSFSDKERKHRALVLFTDGEDHQGGLEPAIEEAQKAEIRIYTIGTGNPEGEPIPLRDENGRKSGFKKDRQGQVVITKLNRPLLEKIAADTGGLYLPSTPGEQEIDILLKHMESMGERQFKEKLITEKEDHFQFFLLLAMLFLILEMFLKPTQNRKSPKVIALLCFFCLSTGFLENPEKINNEANKLYQEKKYKSAAELYQKAKLKNPQDPVIRYNSGTANYQLERYQEAAKDFEKAVADSRDPALKAKALYNYGNTQYRLGNFEKAIEAYKKALEIDPKDSDSKYNLEFLQNKKSLFDKKNQDRQNQKKNQEQKQNQQKQDQNKQDQNQGQQDKQDQQQQDQQKQDQQDQQQQDQQKQDQQDQQQQDQQKKDQQDQQQQDQQKQDQQDQQQQDQQKQDQQDQQQQDQQKQDQQDQQQQDQQKQDQQDEEQPQDINESEEQEEEEEKSEGEEQEQRGGAGQKLQGQMSMQNALQILDALKDGEKELQDLRRPQGQKEPPPGGKDW